MEKKDILQHFDRRLKELNNLLAKTSLKNMRTDEYKLLIDRSSRLLQSAFGAETAEEFENTVAASAGSDDEADAGGYFNNRRARIKKAITILKEYRAKAEKL